MATPDQHPRVNININDESTPSHLRTSIELTGETERLIGGNVQDRNNSLSQEVESSSRETVGAAGRIRGSPGPQRNYVIPAPKLEVTIEKRNNGSYGSTNDPEKPEIENGSEKQKNDEDGGVFLAVLFLVYVFVALMNRLFAKLQTIPMYRYPIFLNILTTAFYVPVSFAYIIPMIHFGTAITPEQTSVPKYKFLVMGSLDCLAAAMSMFATNYIISGSVISLIQQSAIPISMALSKLLLGASYSSSQYLGALMVCAGIFIVLSPSQNSSHGDSGDSSASGNGHSQILWAGVMMVSCVPTVLSSVYKEMALQGKDIDVIYLNGWVATFQFMLCIPLAYPSAFATSLPIDELWPNIYDGLWCFLGYSSTHMDGSVDDCSTAPIFVSIYMFFNLSYNVLIILILKHGSTNIMFMGSTALVPLTNALFACPFIPGHTPMKPADFVGLGVIMAGITVYRFVQRLPCKFLDGGPVDSDDEDEAADEDLAAGGGAAKEGTSKRKDGLYIGLNSIAAETVQPLLETRVILARAQRARMNRLPERPHTRSPYLSRLGIAPSPRVGASPRFSPGTRTPPQRGYNPLRPNPKQRLDGNRQASLA